MKILVLGATGLIGKVVVEKLLLLGHHINFLTTDKAKIDFLNGCSGFYWNPKSQYVDLQAFHDVELILNFSGASIANSWNEKNKNEILTSRVETLNFIYNLIEKNNFKSIKRIVNASAIGGYLSDNTKVYHEDDLLHDNTFLGKVVTNWEFSVLKFNQLGIDVSIVRIGLVLDKNEGVLKKIIPLAKFGILSPLGSGNQYQSWIHILDVASVFVYIIQNNKIGIYNAVAPHPVIQKELFKHIATILKRPYFLPSIPSFILKLILGEQSQLVLDSQRVSCMKLMKEGFQFQFPSIDKALNNLLK